MDAVAAMHNVIVTGGSRGLGLGIARSLTNAGFQVVVVARNAGAYLPTLQQEMGQGCQGRLHFRPFDLSDISGLADFVKSLAREFGSFFGLVNNAGIGTAGVLASMSESDIESLIRLNVLSPITLTKYVARSMMASGGGRIVNVSSVVATNGYPGLSVYSATKSSLIGFTRSLARELGSLDITVNAVAPGFIDTEMTNELTSSQREKIVRRSALKRMPNVTDVADAVDYLFSDKARNITGTVITVDAGNTA